MAPVSVLPCDGHGLCMVCKTKPSPEETLTCKTCATPWHVACLSVRPETLADALQWDCPDCSATPINGPIAANSIGAGGAVGISGGDLIAKIRAVEADESLSEQEKAKRRQKLLSGGKMPPSDGDGQVKNKIDGETDVLDIVDKNINCSFCMQLPERPVTTPCGHNFCLKCFQKWVGQGKRTCVICRKKIPNDVATQPRINSVLVEIIRWAKMSKRSVEVEEKLRVYKYLQNQDRPDEAFATERAKKPGKSNMSCGRIFVTVPSDHFGPITAEYDPERNQGVLVGETWEYRLQCRQWGVHNPHICGISGQSKHGAQSVVLSGGYEDDEDHGDWFLYTGSGGRDLRGNKRTNKDHSFDQKFKRTNEALRLSCLKGYPVRVLRSHKETRSAYAPPKGYRYDGVYRIEKCWQKLGSQGYKICRYLFVRCDNEPAPWTFDDHGDRPRPLPVVREMQNAVDLIDRKESPSWDYDAEKDCWMWKKSPPLTKKRVDSGHLKVGTKMRKAIQRRQQRSTREKLMKEIKCHLCQKVMNLPITTPCGHNFCKACLEGAFAGVSLMRQRTCGGRRTLRARKNVMRCPSCPKDIAEFLQNLQVNTALQSIIESLKQEDAKSEDDAEESEDDVEESEDDAEESSEDIDGSQEKSDLVAEDTKICKASKETLEEFEENISTIQTETKPRETDEAEKPIVDSFMTDANALDGKADFKKCDYVNAELGFGPVEPEKANKKELQATGRNLKQTRKRKKTDDGGNVLTKGKRRKAEAAA